MRAGEMTDLTAQIAKLAYIDGLTDGAMEYDSLDLLQEEIDRMWQASRTRKVIEGEGPR